MKAPSGSTDSILTFPGVVRGIVGARRVILPWEMRALLLTVPGLPDVSTITGRFADGRLHVPGTTPLPHAWPTTPADEASITADAWVRMLLADPILCVSAWWAPEAGVRFDHPGSMHPQQHAQLTFVPAGIGDSAVSYMRRHADRVLLVRS